MEQILFRYILELLVKSITKLCCGFSPQPVILCELQPGPIPLRLHQNWYLSVAFLAKLKRKKPTISKALRFPWHCRRSSRKSHYRAQWSLHSLRRNFLANKEISLTVTKHLSCLLLLNNREIANPSEKNGKPRPVPPPHLISTFSKGQVH